jgi:two-component system, OmpR family, response regulator MprA
MIAGLPPGSPMRILVVDDEVEPRRRLQDVLTGSGHSVVQAESGIGALAVLDREPIDLVITDVVMPDLDGIGLVHRMKTKHQGVKAIVLSASDYSQDEVFLKMARMMGAAAAFRKSISAAQLLAAVDSLARR